MRRRDGPALILFLGVFLVLGLVPWAGGYRSARGEFGRVVDANGPVAGARVAWQGEPASVFTDEHGAFRLPRPRRSIRHVTAAKPGYRIASAAADGLALELRLDPLPMRDNDDYHWLSPAQDCARCHGTIYREWSASAHARAARNPRLASFVGELARDHPLGVAVCALCHAPTLDSPDGDVRHARGVAAEGVHCDYCHKVIDARPDPHGLRFGSDGLDLLRPKDGEQLFYGPLPDAVRRGESFAQLPLYRESRLCANCHEGVVFGVHVYGTYTEWLASPAAAKGVQCQNCHMTPTGTLHNIAPGKGGIDRDPRTLASHGLPGGQVEMLRRCLTVDVRCAASRVDVSVRADNVGHRVPTGFIDRHLILRVQAVGADGVAIALADGPRLPDVARRWSGQAGWLYGKLLRDAKGKAPQPFWLPELTMTDTRLRPGETDKRSFTFARRPARVVVQLWYRRFWEADAAARGWADNEVLVVERDIVPLAG